MHKGDKENKKGKSTKFPKYLLLRLTDLLTQGGSITIKSNFSSVGEKKLINNNNKICDDKKNKNIIAQYFKI